MKRYLKLEPARTLALLATALVVAQAVWLAVTGNTITGDVGAAVTAALAALAELGVRPLVTPVAQPRDNHKHPLESRVQPGVKRP